MTGYIGRLPEQSSMTHRLWVYGGVQTMMMLG
jgi:hypothetical protein